MKRTTCFLLATLMVAILLLAGCKNKKPDNISDTVYEAGLAALKAADAYLDNQMGKTATYDELLAQHKIIKDFGEVHDTKVRHNNFMVQHDVLMLSSAFLMLGRTQTESDLLEKRNDLAVRLGKPSRKY